MDIEEVKKKLKELNITYEEFSKMCNVPVDTLKNILSGRTKNPRGLTEKAIIDTLSKESANANRIVNDYLSTEEEEIIKMYRKLPPISQEIILKNFYILLDPDERQKYNSLKNIK